MTNIFEHELPNLDWQSDLGIETHHNIHDLANNLDGNNILDHESQHDWQQNHQSLDWQDCQQYNTQDQNFDQSSQNWDYSFPSAPDEAWNNWHDNSISTTTDLGNDHNQFTADNQDWNNWQDNSASTTTDLANDHNLYAASPRFGSSWDDWHQDGAKSDQSWADWHQKGAENDLEWADWHTKNGHLDAAASSLESANNHLDSAAGWQQSAKDHLDSVSSS